MSKVEERLKKLGIELIEQEKTLLPIARTKRCNNLLFVSGHGSDNHGKVGSELTLEQGYKAARDATINCLSSIKSAIGDLDKVIGFIKILGTVNSEPDFIEHPSVINGVSDLLIEAFGEEIGSHARSAVGLQAVSHNIAVGVEMIVEIKD